MTSKQEAIISGEQIKNMLLGAYKSFEKNYQYINDLNVFPVPDGDTGTNMMHTMAAVAREISQLQNATVSEVGTMAARSAIMGARGNSGVILSQLLRGLGKGLAGKKRATSNEVGKAFQFGILYAYRAVSKPVEGTILTVARAIAKGAYHAVRQGEDFEDVLCEALESGKKELARTPELLPALKAAGVVDAGGQGLIVFLEGCLAGFRGEDAGELHLPPSKPSFANFIEMEVDLENPYCTEFIVKEAEVKEDVVRSTLQPLGNSLIVAVVGGSSSRFGGAVFDANGAASKGTGSRSMDCGEGMDTAKVHIPAAQEELVAELARLGKPMVTVVIAGRAYCIEDIENASNALLYAFYPGPMGGKAVAEMLYGTTNPSGRLPVSMPRHAGQIPVCYNYRTSVVPAYCDMTSQPLHTFGEGKSYTTFACSDVSVNKEEN